MIAEFGLQQLLGVRRLCRRSRKRSFAARVLAPHEPSRHRRVCGSRVDEFAISCFQSGCNFREAEPRCVGATAEPPHSGGMRLSVCHAGRVVFWLGILILGFAFGAGAQSSAEWRSWNQPVQPFRMIGNIYYVGASGVTAFLITTPQGHILLDGGFVETAPMILKNIRTLGFQPRDVKFIVFSHAHADHVGGLAELKRATGAKLVSSLRDAEMLRAGGHDDFTFGDRMLFPAVEPDQIIATEEKISVGGVSLTAYVTAGHTKGCTTWITLVQDGRQPRSVVFHCSTSVPGHKLVNNAKYPEIVKDYEESFRTLHNMPCEVFFAPHAGFFQLDEKRRQLRDGHANPFVDPQGCAAYLQNSEKAFRQELEKQRKQAGIN